MARALAQQLLRYLYRKRKAESLAKWKTGRFPQSCSLCPNTAHGRCTATSRAVTIVARQIREARAERQGLEVQLRRMGPLLAVAENAAGKSNDIVAF